MTSTPDIHHAAHSQNFSWRAHPATERVSHAVMAGVVVIGMAAVVYVSFNSIGWALLSLAVLVASLNRFFFPSTFIIDEKGITARYPLRRRRESWRDLRRFVHDQHGGYLSTRAAPSRLDAYRGLHILFGEDRGTAIERIGMFMASQREDQGEDQA